MVGPLVAEVVSQVTGARVVELYAGVGLFSVPLSARGATVIAIEGDPVSGTDLRLNATDGVGTLDARIGDAAEGLRALGSFSPDVIVVDPPRTGLLPEALAGCLRLGPRRLSTCRAIPPRWPVTPPR